ARIFQAEAKDGYRDKIVIGGLAAFAANLGVAQVSQLLADYAALEPTERAERLKQAASVLLNGAVQPRPPGVARRRTPSTAGKESPPPPVGVTLSTSVQALKGVGPVRGRLYTRLGIHTVKDLLFHFPVPPQAFLPAVALGHLV